MMRRDVQKRTDSKSGFSLAEMGPVLILSAIVMAAIGVQMTAVNKASGVEQSVIKMEQNNLELARTLQFYFRRGHRVAFNACDEAGNCKPLAADSVDPLLFIQNGTMVIDADLRPCSTGANSFSLSNTVTSLSRIIISCCGSVLKGSLKGLSFPTNVDGAVSTNINQTVSTVCPEGIQKKGALVVEIRPPTALTKTGAINCYPDYRGFSLSKAGTHGSLNSDLYYLELIGRPGNSNPGAIMADRRFENYFSLANTGSSPNTLCSEQIRGN